MGAGCTLYSVHGDLFGSRCLVVRVAGRDDLASLLDLNVHAAGIVTATAALTQSDAADAEIENLPLLTTPGPLSSQRTSAAT